MTTGVASGNVIDEPGQPTLMSVVTIASMMGFDPVELEYHFQMPYSKYNSHMGHEKEIARVAT